MMKEMYHGFKTMTALGLYTAGGAVLATQLARIPGMAQQAQNLEHIAQQGMQYVGANPQLASSVTTGVEIALAAGLLKAASDGIKRARKAQDFKEFMDANHPNRDASSKPLGKAVPSSKPSSKEVNSRGKEVAKSLARNGLVVAKRTALPTAIAGLAFAGYRGIPGVGNSLVDAINSSARAISNTATGLYTSAENSLVSAYHQLPTANQCLQSAHAYAQSLVANAGLSASTTNALTIAGEVGLGALIVGAATIYARNLFDRRAAQLDKELEDKKAALKPGETLPAEEPLWKRLGAKTSQYLRSASANLASKLPVIARKSALPVASIAAAYGMYKGIPLAWEQLSSAINHAASMAAQYGNDLVARVGATSPYTEVPLKVGAGLLMATAGAQLRAFNTSRKHGPTLKVYDIDGYTSAFQTVSWTNLRMRLQKYYQSKKLVQLPADAVMNAAVKVHDMVTGETRDSDTIGYRMSLEPSLRNRSITVDDCASVINRLSQYKQSRGGENKQQILGKDVDSLAEQSGLLKEIKSMYADRKTRDKALDMLEVIETLGRNQDEDIAKLTNPELFERTKSLAQVEGNGFFYRAYYETDNGAPVARMTLSEDPASAIHQSRSAYGPNFAKNGRFLQVLVYKYITGQQGQDGEHTAEDAGHLGDVSHQTDDPSTTDSFDEDDNSHLQDSSTANVVRQYKKAWNTTLSDGLGQAFSVLYNGKTYCFDERWMASGGFLPWIIPVPGIFGSNMRPRRTGYITNSDGVIVAKLEETSSFTKLFGNYNTRVSVFDKELAKTDSFGMLMGLISQYMPVQNRYIANRIANQTAQVFHDSATPNR